MRLRVGKRVRVVSVLLQLLQQTHPLRAALFANHKDKQNNDARTRDADQHDSPNREGGLLLHHPGIHAGVHPRIDAGIHVHVLHDLAGKGHFLDLLGAGRIFIGKDDLSLHRADFIGGNAHVDVIARAGLNVSDVGARTVQRGEIALHLGGEVIDGALSLIDIIGRQIHAVAKHDGTVDLAERNGKAILLRDGDGEGHGIVCRRVILAVHIIKGHLHRVRIRRGVRLGQERDLFLRRLAGSNALDVEGAGGIRGGKGRARSRVVRDGGHLDDGIFDTLRPAGVLEVHGELELLAAEHSLPAVIIALENHHGLHLRRFTRSGIVRVVRRTVDKDESVRRLFRHLVGGNGDRHADVARRHGGGADHREGDGRRRAGIERGNHLHVQFAVDGDPVKRRQHDVDIVARLLSVVPDCDGEIEGVAFAQVFLVDGIIFHHQAALLFHRLGGRAFVDNALCDCFLTCSTICTNGILPCKSKFNSSN